MDFNTVITNKTLGFLYCTSIINSEFMEKRKEEAEVHTHTHTEGTGIAQLYCAELRAG